MTTPRSRRPTIRLAGHRLSVEWNGERSRSESASTGTCPCGWTESASTQSEVRNEYRYHLQNVRLAAARAALAGGPNATVAYVLGVPREAIDRIAPPGAVASTTAA